MSERAAEKEEVLEKRKKRKKDLQGNLRSSFFPFPRMFLTLAGETNNDRLMFMGKGKLEKFADMRE